MPDAHVPVLAEEAGVWFFGAAFFDFSTNYGETFHRLLEAFRSGGGVPQEAYGEEVVASIERFTAPWFEHRLVSEWIPAMPNVQALLEAGATICDVGCGRGRELIKLAQAFPRCQFMGIDAYEPAIHGARNPSGERRGDRACALRGGGRGCRIAKAVRRRHNLRRYPRLRQSAWAVAGHSRRPRTHRPIRVR
jgi:SAM-dependent methyltransferase